MPQFATVEKFSSAEKHLIAADPQLGRLIKQQGPIAHQPSSDYFANLARSIIGQQVSVAAARAIFGRFEEATGLQPSRVLDLSDEELRAAGLSRQKISYLRDLAVHFVENPKVFSHFSELADDVVLEQLMAVKGIGAWTAQMFLMFTLARPDIFAPDDAGLQRAMKRLFAWKDLPPKAELIEVAETWRPYRTIACWHLWQSLRNDPGRYNA